MIHVKQIHLLHHHLFHSCTHKQLLTRVGVDESLFSIHWTQTEYQLQLIHQKYLIY